jgi:UDP-glucose 4-epimerase
MAGVRYNMKSIYITGIAGLIGSSLAKYYLLKGWKVSGCDSLIGGYESNVPKAIQWDKIDILNLEFSKDYASIFAKSNWDPRKQKSIPYDVIIHTACSPHEGLSVVSPSIISNSVYATTMKMASLAIEHKARLFINCSSMARYGAIQTPFSETQTPIPHDPYGLAKLHAEQQLELLASIYPEFNYYTVIPHNVCGAQQVYNDPYRNVLSIMIHQALQNFPIFIYGDGKQTRSFSHVDDCVEAINNLIEIQPEEKLFNIGPDHNDITINEVADLILKTVHSNSKIIHLPGRAREVKQAFCDCTLAKTILKYESQKDILRIITDITKFIMLNGVKDFKYNLPIEINSSLVPKTWSRELFGKSEIRLHNERIVDEKFTSR